MKNRKNTQVRLSTETAETVRIIAAEFGFVVQRGVGAGQFGNIAAMLDILAIRWHEDADAVRQGLRVALQRPLTE